MCRSRSNTADGQGRLCPSHTNPARIAERNARRRAAYFAGKNGESSTIEKVVSAESHGFIPITSPRRFTMNPDDVTTESEAEVSHLSDLQLKTLEGFTDTEYEWVNGLLYKKMDWMESKDSYLDDLDTFTGHMDAAFMAAPIKERIVYRGKKLDGELFMGEEENEDMTPEEYIEQNYTVGSEVVFDGYMSTSLDPTLAGHYADDGGLVLEMKSKTGINVSAISQHEDEYEVLLPRATRWKVLSVDKVDDFEMTVGNTGRPVTLKDMTVVRMVEVDELGEETSKRTSPPKLSLSNSVD